MPLRICPRCTKILQETTVCEITVEGCPECGGSWFDQGELNEVAKRDPTALEQIDRAFTPSDRVRAMPTRELRCPVCLARLERFEFKHFPGVQMDGCARCRGIWADHGELREIARRIRNAKT